MSAFGGFVYSAEHSRDPDLEDVFEEIEDAELSAGGIAYKRFNKDLLRYGAFAKNLEDLPEDAETYYLTTAIAYTNGLPHVGHAYEFLTSDVLVRLHRFLGYRTYFLTGSDEHGQKVAEAAAKAGLEPLAHCNKYVSEFQRLNDKLRVTNDKYLRTTSALHKKTCQMLWKRCSDAGDIYLDKYEGWYNEREELFVTQAEAEKTNFMDVEKNVPLKRVSEESYFFRMSKYCDALIQHIEQNPSFVQPESACSNILARLRKEGLKDLSITRTTFSWGISLAADFDQTGTTGQHVMYVWFDALTNYLTGVCALDTEAEGHARLSSFWPANRHIIGKDISWFHCVIWPTILMSAGLPLPVGVFSHGFVNARDGRKMSKSLNNSVDPDDILRDNEIDAIRYYMVSAATYGSDLNFALDTIDTMRSAELADVLGNLVQRGLNLCQLYCAGVVPDAQHDEKCGLPFDLAKLIADTKAAARDCSISVVLSDAMEAVRATNRWLTESEPWKMKGEDQARRPSIVRTTLEAIYAFTHFLAPIIPIAADKIFKRLHTAPRRVGLLRPDLYNLEPGRAVELGAVLFPRKDDVAGGAAGGAGAGAGAGAAVAGTKATTGAAAAPKKKEAPPADDPNQVPFTKLDLRVGVITKVWHHESSDKLFCEEVDIGTAAADGSPLLRPVVSGLRQHYTLEQLAGRKVVFVANLPEAKLAGFVSTGMVLAATSADGSKVELLTPPAGAAVGERVVLIDPATGSPVSGEPWASSRVKNKKLWPEIAKDLRTNTESPPRACWAGQVLMTSAGPCVVESNADSVVA